MRQKLKKWLFFSCLLFSIQIFAITQAIPVWILRWQQTKKIPALSLGMQTANQVPRYFLSGATTGGGDIKISQNTLFGVGSITKTFVAATLLQLQEAKRLNLDDPIGPYFPEYPRWSKITIRQLLNMTSGIPNFTQLAAFKNLSSLKQREIYHPPAFFIDMAYQQKDHFLPGQAWEYSNTNYYLLGKIIEKVTGTSLEKQFKQRFFRPLHLTHSYYSDEFYPEKIKQQSAHPYYNGQDFINANPAYYGAAGSMLMSVADLMTWTRDLFTPGKVLSAESLKQWMSTNAIPYAPPKPRAARYGLGIYSLPLTSGGLIWWYTGVVNGYSSVMIWIPSQNEIIVAQINAWQGQQFGLLMPGQDFLNAVFKILNVNQKN